VNLGLLSQELRFIQFDRPKRGRVRAKTCLTGQRNRRLPISYLQPCIYEYGLLFQTTFIRMKSALKNTSVVHSTCSIRSSKCVTSANKIKSMAPSMAIHPTRENKSHTKKINKSVATRDYCKVFQLRPKQGTGDGPCIRRVATGLHASASQNRAVLPKQQDNSHKTV